MLDQDSLEMRDEGHISRALAPCRSRKHATQNKTHWTEGPRPFEQPCAGAFCRQIEHGTENACAESTPVASTTDAGDCNLLVKL